MDLGHPITYAALKISASLIWSGIGVRERPRGLTLMVTQDVLSEESPPYHSKTS